MCVCMCDGIGTTRVWCNMLALAVHASYASVATGTHAHAYVVCCLNITLSVLVLSEMLCDSSPTVVVVVVDHTAYLVSVRRQGLSP